MTKNISAYQKALETAATDVLSDNRLTRIRGYIALHADEIDPRIKLLPKNDFGDLCYRHSNSSTTSPSFGTNDRGELTLVDYYGASHQPDNVLELLKADTKQFIDGRMKELRREVVNEKLSAAQAAGDHPFQKDRRARGTAGQHGGKFK